MATAKILGQDHKVLNNTDEQFEEGSSIVYPFAEDRDTFIEDTIDSSLLDFDRDDASTNLFDVLQSIFKKAKEVVITTKSPEDDDGIPLVDPSLSKILFSPDGTFTLYNPDFEKLAEGESASVTFTYVLNEGGVKNGKGNGKVVVREVTVEVTGTNEAPILVDELDIDVTEDTLFEGQLVATDIDSDDNAASLKYILEEGEYIPGFSFNEDGSYTLDANALYQHLREGEVVEYSFQWRAEDRYGASTAVDDVKITITGTNDAPVVVVHEDQGVDEGESLEGQVVATDIDSDDNSASLKYILVEGENIPGFVFNENGSYTLDASVVDYQYLAKDETVTYTFKWQAEDSHGALSGIDSVEVTITGTNDLPIVAYSDLSGELIELVIPDGSLSETGTINFSDANIDDIHTIASVTPSTGVLGTLIANVTSDTLGSGVGGVISWDYTILASDVEYLAKDQTKVDAFTITLDDGNGGLVDRVVEITITGTNDAPVIVSQEDQGVTEDTVLYGQVVATDIDSDDNTASLKYLLIDGSSIPGFLFHEDGSYSLDATVNAYQSLAMDETDEYTFKWQAEDSNGAQSSIDEVKIIVTGTNDTPTVASALITYTFNLLEGASDVDHGALLHIENLLEADGKDGWIIHNNTMSIDSDFNKYLYENDITETFDFTYNIVDEHGASVTQSLSFEIEGKALPSLSLSTSAGSRANIIMLSVTANPFETELLNLSFNNLPVGAAIFDASTNDVTAGISNFLGTQTFQIVLPEDQDINTDFSVTVTGDTGAQNIQSVELSYDVSSATELVSFSSQDQNMWGNFDGTIGWHEYIPFVGEVSQEWNDETKVWDDLDVDPWSSGWFNIIDLNINSNNIYDILLAVPKGALEALKLAQSGLEFLLQEAKDWLDDAVAKFNHITDVAGAWVTYGLKYVAYKAAQLFLNEDGVDDFKKAEEVFDEAQGVIDWLEGSYNSAYSAWYSANQDYLNCAWYEKIYYGAIAAALWTAKGVAWTAFKAGELVYDVARSVFDFAQGVYEDLVDDVVALGADVTAAYNHATNLENNMHDDGYYTDLAYDDGDAVLIAGAVGLSTGEVATAGAAVGTAEVTLAATDLLVIGAQETYDLAYTALDFVMDETALDFSTELKVDANLYAEIGLQIDFELDLGSVDTDIDYMLTSYTHYNQTTDMLSILPTMTNMTTGDSVAYSTISPNVTFFVAVLYDIWADLEIYMDAYLSAWHIELDEYFNPIWVDGMIFDVSPDTDGITINTTVSTDSWSDLLDALPVDFLPDLPTDLEAGELVLVDFDSTELEPFEVPFIETLTGGALNIELAFPTIETEGVEEEYTQSYFEEGGLINVDFSEISGAIFNLVNAKLEYSEEFLDMYSSVSPLGDSQTIDDLINSLVDAFLAILWDNLDAHSTAAPIFVLDATDESSTSLLHVNLFPDEVMTDTLSSDTADFGFYTSYGESDPVLKITLDIDAVVAVIANKVIKAVIAASTAGVGATLEAIPTINPLDLEFGIAEILEMVEVPEDVAEEITNFVDLGIKIETADIDAYAAVDFSQEFSLSIDDMSYAVTFENGDVEYFSANTEGELLINDASSYDLNEDGIVEYSLEIVPTAMFSNDTEVGLSMGYSIELLQAELTAGVTLPLNEILGDPFPDIPISLVDMGIGPLLTIEGDLDILDVDVFESRFDFDIGSDETELLTVGVTDQTMFVA